jgi:hypothetical protein
MKPECKICHGMDIAGFVLHSILALLAILVGAAVLYLVVLLIVVLS